MAVPGLFTPVPYAEHLLIDGGTSNPLPFDLLQGEVDLVIAVDVSGNSQPDLGQEIGLSDTLFTSFKTHAASYYSASAAPSGARYFA